MDQTRVLPLPYLIRSVEEKIDPTTPLEIPMRCFGKILKVDGKECFSFQYGNEIRSLEAYQNELNDFYGNQKLMKAIEICEDTTYIIHFEDNFLRCHLVDVHARCAKPRIFYLIDYGRTVEVDKADLYYLNHPDTWNNEAFRFAFAGVCRLADKNQCKQLGIPSADQFVPGEEVEIYLLSSQEPFYAVVSSLRNPEINFFESSLSLDMLPEGRDAWAALTTNQISMEPAERSTLCLTPKWIHGKNAVLVTIPHIESLDKVAVRDLQCSLRARIFVDILSRHYQKDHVRQALRITDAFSQLGVGVIVVAHDRVTNRYHRAQITEMNAEMTLLDLVGIDTPQWRIFHHPVSDVLRLCRPLEVLPRMVHYFPLIRDFSHSHSYELQSMTKETAKCHCAPHSVALLQLNDNTLEADILCRNETNDMNNLKDRLVTVPDENSLRSRYGSTASLVPPPVPEKNKKLKIWTNEVPDDSTDPFAFKPKEEKAVEA